MQNQFDSSLYSEAGELQLEEKVRVLLDKVSQLEKENLEMTIALEEAGICKEDVKISETEFICLQQLRKIKEQSEQRLLDKDEVGIIDVLHKNLLIARGIPVVKKTKERKKSKEELFKILDN